MRTAPGAKLAVHRADRPLVERGEVVVPPATGKGSLSIHDKRRAGTDGRPPRVKRRPGAPRPERGS